MRATLLISEIDVSDEPEPFDALLIPTTHKTTLDKPSMVTGPGQLYRPKRAKENAGHVEFLAGNLSGAVTVSPTQSGPIAPGDDCTGPFAGAHVMAPDGSGNVAAVLMTDEPGLFDARVPSGNYLLRTGCADGARLPACADTLVAVPGEAACS